ncbi:nucleotide exchange factor GrpE [Candidatus Peribacteria bacterium RIFCSPHIGHO2_02_FULL_49_16]|nr:MAG: nucleotide exchange factor GrpE [Candidatus Peribacteria bacterium RIFCSPHIGHO2_01_FULL_49_38]OGJ58518.1 MAG: nucleotide exchange factor GrpE [Candidatus Peribacteria bacterium RIFCSPHIGHO2_02_FULL_49_16]
MSGKQQPKKAAVGKQKDHESTHLRAELERFKNLAARAQADVQNIRARLEREAEEHRRYALQDALIKMLPVLNSFQRAKAHLPQDLADNEWVKGVCSAIHGQEQWLSTLDVKTIDVLGKPLDPTCCEVLAVGPGEENIVLEILEEGYLFGERVLRPAKVKVGRMES